MILPDESVESSVHREGSILGNRYRILAHLASGGMGLVFEGEHLITRRRVAIKLLRERYATDSQMLKRFHREAINAAKLSSDFVPAVTDFGTAPDGIPFMVMELLHGETLRCLLQRKRKLPYWVAAELIRDACRAVAHAHTRGIIHRDLKPSNIFLEHFHGGSARVKLLDFGIAKALDPLNTGVQTQVGRVLGTPPYMSPEQAAGLGALDTRTDIYGLGLVLYETLAGRLPHTGHNSMVLRAQIVRELPTPLNAVMPNLPPPLVQVVHRALEPRPEDRFPAAASMAKALEPFVRRSSLGQTQDVRVAEFDGAEPLASARHATAEGTAATATETLTRDSEPHGSAAESLPASPRSGGLGKLVETPQVRIAGVALVIGGGLGALLVGLGVRPRQQTFSHATPVASALVADDPRGAMRLAQPIEVTTQTASPSASLVRLDGDPPSVSAPLDEPTGPVVARTEEASGEQDAGRSDRERPDAVAVPRERPRDGGRHTRRAPESSQSRAASTTASAERHPSPSRPTPSGVRVDSLSPYADHPL